MAEKQEEPEVKTDAPGNDINRYVGEEVWDAKTALDALSSITYLLDSESNETERSPEQIAALKAVVANLKTFIASEIKEDTQRPEMVPAVEVVEMVAEGGEVERTEPSKEETEAKEGSEPPAADGDVDDVERIGKEMSKKNAERVQAMHDHAAALGATCKGGSVEKTAEESDVFRVAGLDMDIPGIEGAKAVINRLVERLVALESEPEPAKGATKVVTVTKEQDVLRINGDVTVEAPPSTPLEAIKRIHQGGGVRGLV